MILTKSNSHWSDVGSWYGDTLGVNRSLSFLHMSYSQNLAIIHSSKIDDLELYTKYWPWPTWIWWKNTYNMMFDGAGCRGCLISENSPDTWQRRWMLDGCGWGKINPWKTHGKPMGYPYFKKPAWVTIVCHPEKKITPCCDDRPLNVVDSECEVVDSECEPAQTKRRSVSLLLFHL